MTRFYLVRHAPHAAQGRVLVGRSDAVGLDPAQRWRAECLAGKLAREPVAAIHSSPSRRCRETAAILAEVLGRPVETVPELDEIEFGDWTGRHFEELDPDPRWRLWNRWRTGTTPPAGESMAQVQHRFVAHMQAVRTAYPDGTVLLVSHGDPIRSALAFWLGLPLDLFQRLEVDPASLSCVELTDWGPRILGLNETAIME